MKNAEPEVNVTKRSDSEKSLAGTADDHRLDWQHLLEAGARQLGHWRTRGCDRKAAELVFGGIDSDFERAADGLALDNLGLAKDLRQQYGELRAESVRLYPARPPKDHPLRDMDTWVRDADGATIRPAGLHAMCAQGGADLKPAEQLYQDRERAVFECEGGFGDEMRIQLRGSGRAGEVVSVKQVQLDLGNAGARSPKAELDRRLEVFEGHLTRCAGIAAPPPRWTGKAITFQRAAEILDYRGQRVVSGDALRKAIKRAKPDEPLYNLRQDGPARFPNGRLREDAVLHVKRLLGLANADRNAD